MLIDLKIQKKPTFNWFMAADRKMQANKKKVGELNHLVGPTSFFV